MRRATVALAGTPTGGMDQSIWDDVATRDSIAFALYSLHLRDERPVDEVDWGSVMWHLRDDQRLITLVEGAVPGARRALVTDSEELVTPLDRWKWLNRTWDPGGILQSSTLSSDARVAVERIQGEGRPADARSRWDGLSRRRGSWLPDPAIEVCVSWAANVVGARIAAENHGYAVHQRVRVTDGPSKGRRGYVKELGWAVDDAAQTVRGPAGYVVDLDYLAELQDIDADQLTASRDYTWPRRPTRSLKNNPDSSDLRQPSPPPPSCAESLEEVLNRVANAQIVPMELREAAQGAYEYQGAHLDRQAAPRPQRLSWQVLLHTFRLTESYEHPRYAELYEIVFTRHLQDDDPIRLLALDEKAVWETIATRAVPR
ncbi:KOW domain-containing RNA-binding protein [Streptomyces bluensis]|uniref:Uncharacterized protein n=1 Tax=Streptomyces bluensis TaxID=33897 RepID=A0ABW6UBB4_9ACTN